MRDQDARLGAGVVNLVVVDVELLASGLRYPEGPIAMSDGSVLVCEIVGGALTRVTSSGAMEVARCGGGPNGAALAPDGSVYICNNGGRSAPGYIQRVELDSGRVELVYESCDGQHLIAPNDLVFDRDGNFWFTDIGKTWPDRYEFGALYYATPDGSSIVRGVHPAEHPNGVALSRDETTLYWAEMMHGRVQRRGIVDRGRVEDMNRFDPASVICGLPGVERFDSMAIDPDGNVCVATLVSGRITVIAPDGAWVCQVAFPDEFFDWQTTNVCFGGPDGRTAFVTLGGTGRLLSFPWPERFPGQ